MTASNAPEIHRPRGIAPGKTQVSWRIRTDMLEQAKEEAQALGLSSIPAFVNYLLASYFRGDTIKQKREGRK